jgi:phosphatidylglycerophosphate synthase
MSSGPTPSASGRFATFANGLPHTRAGAGPCVAKWILHEATIVAFGLFVWAVATDFADGSLARHRGEASSLGGLLDHSTDALFCSVGLGALAWTGVVPAALPFLVAAAFLQYMLDSRSIAGQPLRASFLGRWNGILYFVMVGIPIVRNALGIEWPGPGLVTAIGWALVVSTVVSMGDRGYALMRSS